MFVQNPFTADFYGSWVLGDRQHCVDFKCPSNKGRGDEVVQAYGQSPYDLSGNDADGNAKKTLNITVAMSVESFKHWFQIDVDLTPTGSDTYILSAVSIADVVAKLNANSTFSAWFSACDINGSVRITQKRPVTSMRFYINNGQAEEVLKFNKFAGVADIPTYFIRHTVGDTYRLDFTDAQNALVYLDLENDVDCDVITNAVDGKGNNLGLTAVAKEDWQLLKGRSGIFNFQKITVDGSDRMTEIIEYPAGAVAGDLGRNIVYTYDGANKQPSTIKEMPYTLTSSDLI